MADGTRAVYRDGRLYIEVEAVISIPVVLDLMSTVDSVMRIGGTLPPRQGKILALMLRGLVAKEIATELDMSTRAVKHHLGLIYARFKVRDRSQLTALFVNQNAVGGA